MTVKRFPVEESHIMMFARSVGDDNQIYYDAAYAKTTEPGAIIAPPTLINSSRPLGNSRTSSGFLKFLSSAFSMVLSMSAPSA